MLRWLDLVLLLAAACSTSSVSAVQPDEQVHTIHLYGDREYRAGDPFHYVP